MATGNGLGKSPGDRWTIIGVGVSLALLYVIQMGQIRSEFTGLRDGIGGLRTELRTEIGGLRDDMSGLRERTAKVETELRHLRDGQGDIEEELRLTKDRVANVETKLSRLQDGQGGITEALRLTKDHVAIVETELVALKNLPQLSRDWGIRNFVDPEAPPGITSPPSESRP